MKTYEILHHLYTLDHTLSPHGRPTTVTEKAKLRETNNKIIQFLKGVEKRTPNRITSI